MASFLFIVLLVALSEKQSKSERLEKHYRNAIPAFKLTHHDEQVLSAIQSRRMLHSWSQKVSLFIMI